MTEDSLTPTFMFKETKISLRPGESVCIEIQVQNDQGTYLGTDIVEVTHHPTAQKLFEIYHTNAEAAKAFLSYYREPGSLK